MVMDFLVCVFLNELYPNIAKGKSPDIYHTGERFLGIKESVKKAISENKLVVNFPQIKFWQAIPLLNYSRGNWMSTNMSKEDISQIIAEIYENDKNLLKDLLRITLRLKDPILEHQIKRVHEQLDRNSNQELVIEKASAIIFDFFEKIKEMIDNSVKGELKKITYITTKDHLNQLLQTINPAKMEILKYCNGSHTIEEIAKKVSIKESSTRSYISHMKKDRLITHEKKPLRVTDEVVIIFE